MTSYRRRKIAGRNKKVFVPPPGYKSKEQSCQSCRVRKVRCTGGRPACALCLKAAANRGASAEGVRCHYSAASLFAQKGDAELEQELGGKETRCYWGDPEVDESGEDGSQIVGSKGDMLGDDRTTPGLSSPFSVPSSLSSSSSTLSPSPSVCNTPTAPYLSPAAASTPFPPAFPSVPPSFTTSRSASAPPTLPHTSTQAEAPPFPTPINSAASAPSPLLRSPSPVRQPLSSIFLTATPDLSNRRRNQNYPILPASSLWHDHTPPQPQMAVLPPTIKRDAGFWDGGPLSLDEIRRWSGLMYVARKHVGGG